MSSTATAYRDSNPPASENRPRYFSRDEIAGLIPALDIPYRYKHTYGIYWRLCHAPDGTEIKLWKSTPQLARAAGICETTARAHLRAWRDRFDLIEFARDRSGRELKANTRRHAATYRMKTETLAGNRWPECKRCGHKHQAEQECGCDLGSRQGRFHTKGGGVLEKLVEKRTCRCRPASAPSLFRPQPVPVSTPAAPTRSQEPRSRISAERQPPALTPRQRAELGRRIEFYKDGQTRWLEEHGGYVVTLTPGDARYVKPLPQLYATLAGCKSMCQGDAARGFTSHGCSMGRAREAAHSMGYEVQGKSSDGNDP